MVGTVASFNRSDNWMNRIDPAKLGQWFDTYAARLVLYARQWMSAGAAQDVVQDVFVRLMCQPQEPGNVQAWLFRSVRNAAISEARSGQRRRVRENSVAAGRADWFEKQPEDLIDAEAAQKALERLPDLQREIVVLRIWADLTLQEIAETVGRPLSTVHDQYRAGLLAVRHEMESSCKINNP
jgi:RNA polymerase sigma-70 factor (ECF subfamily)